MLGKTVAAALAISAGMGSAAYAQTTADYQMNEGPGATVMQDSSGNGLNGTIPSGQIVTGFQFNGATGYDWPRRSPTAPPPDPRRVITVPDNINLEPGTGYAKFTITLRYRTKENFGNITQKGQATTRGGQWKIQNPQGRPSCLFKGSTGQAGARVPTPINDNQWHVLTCTLTPTRLTVSVDGVQVAQKNNGVGTLDNKYPLAIGGKTNCDQSTVTCDYFSGDIDYLKIDKE